MDSLVSIRAHDDVVWVEVQPQGFDDKNCLAVEQQVLAAAAQQPSQPVLLDLSHVDSIASVALGVLVGLARTFHERGRRFVVAGAQQSVRGTLSLTRLNKLFEMQPTVEAALARIARVKC
jgi:anti-anti-sigma factor